MRVTIYQPRYFPQLHYFNRMIEADVFVFLDNAQYTKSLRQKTQDGEKRTSSFQSDTPIKLSSGMHLLTIPIHHNGYETLQRIKIDYAQKWPTKHTSVVKNAYHKSREFAAIHHELKRLLSVNYLSLGNVNCVTTLWALSYLLEFHLDLSSITLADVNKRLAKQNKVRLKKILFASQLPVPRPEGLQKGTQWTTALCTYLGANEYMYGGTAKQNYMQFDYYTSHGVTPILQNWKCASYPQQFENSTPFIPNLSIIDLLCNVDAETARTIITTSAHTHV